MAIIERGNEYIDTQAEARQAAWDKRFPTDSVYYADLRHWAISEYLNGSESSREATAEAYVDELCNSITTKTLDDLLTTPEGFQSREGFVKFLMELSEDAFREACCDE